MSGVGEKRKRSNSSSSSSLSSASSSSEDEEEESNKERFSRLKRTNQTEIAFDFDESECDYMVIASDKNIKLSTSFLQYASDDFTSLPKEIDMCSYSRNSLVDVLTFYLPRVSNSRYAISMVVCLYLTVHHLNPIVIVSLFRAGGFLVFTK